MLKYDNVTAYIHKKEILHEISASFPYGTITAILGPNGCGKSTLLHCILNHKLIRQGSITLDDRPLLSYPPKEKAKRIAFLPQIHELPPITVRTLVTQGRFPYTGPFGTSNFLDMKAIIKAMTDTNVISMSERPLTTLSGGEQKRAYLAMILAQNTDYIILDEPTTFLDIKHRLELLELLIFLRDQGKTVIVVLHDINEALHIADVVLLMKEGYIVKTLCKHELLDRALIQEIFQVQMDYVCKDNQTLTSFSLYN